MKLVISIFVLLALSTTVFGQTQAMNRLVYELRNPETQPQRFRACLESVGEYLALDLLEELSTKEVSIKTLTGEVAKHQLPVEAPVLITILRAGLPLNIGVQKVFPDSDVGFLAMSRDEITLKAKIDYIGIPDLKDKSVIITDTMLATGGSILDAIKIVEQYQPKRIFVICAIASKPGIERLHRYNPSIQVFAGTVDPALNEKGYIIPGLGDAGDRSYGCKHFCE